MTASIHTTPEIAHRMAKGTVRQHRARLRQPAAGRPLEYPYRPGRSYTVVPAGKDAICRVAVTDVTVRQVGDLQPDDLDRLGHRRGGRASFARHWLGSDAPDDDAELLARFDRYYAGRTCWVVTIEPDPTAAGTLLHRDPARNYTSQLALAAQGEPEAMIDHVPRWATSNAQAKREQQIADAELALASLRASLARLDRIPGLDARTDRRVIERRIESIERKLANRNEKEAC
ncbi:hypothetical protein [Patulibacter defluvii]|uniref:hypothetical protein n=1 Tax=Patulibacter defluvii TaxID=3095358 RepID=UPI002A749CA2|nr:hypothetical protein [Patulibacter sp. DM4]